MILPKKQDLDKAKNDERKHLIDEGIFLANKVDKLRETSANEEQRLKDWRESSLKLVQLDIAKFNEEKETVKHEIEEARRDRDELLKPLTKEWEEIYRTKEHFTLTQQIIWEDKEIIRAEKEGLEKDRTTLSNLISKATQNEKDTDKTKNETITLKEMAKSEFKQARIEHQTQSDTYDKAMSETNQSRKEYEVALSLIKIRENEVKEKESDIINREKHLASQQVALRIASEVINKNATNKHNEV